MRLLISWRAALALGLTVLAISPTHAAQSRNNHQSGGAGEAASRLDSYETLQRPVDEGWEEGSPYVASESMAWQNGRSSRQGEFYLGAEYLNVRATFSEANAVLLITQFTNFNEQYDYIPLEFDYGSSYRVYGGYRLNDCGEEIVFGFTRYDSGAGFDSGLVPVPPPTGVANQFFRDPYQESPLGPDDRVLVDADVNANSYDLAFAKTIPLGGSAGCGDACGDACCDPCCGGCGCPLWDLTWRAGVRFAEVDWERNSLIDRPTALDDASFSTLDFEGGGPRVGISGTRYFGRRQAISVFAKSDASLLLGTVDLVNSQNDNAIVTKFSTTQIVPVFDIEVGSSLQVTRNINVSAGYLFSAWFDLGMRDTIVPNSVEAGAFWDDANILGFDGFFARAEVAF